MNLKVLYQWKFSSTGDFYNTSFANVIVIAKLKAGSMRIRASPRSQLSKKMMKTIQIQGFKNKLLLQLKQQTIMISYGGYHHNQ